MDLPVVFSRAARRAGLVQEFTQGFSPHMRVAFTSALPVGTSSDEELFDLVLTSYVPPAEALARLKAAAPCDLAPTNVCYVDMRTPALTAAITRAAESEPPAGASVGVSAAGVTISAYAGYGYSSEVETVSRAGSVRCTVITHNGSTNDTAVAANTSARLKAWKVSRLSSSLKNR